MPAMSPTMTEGNIASWKVKEGDSFAAGDVLLEIETDKAQMDVEAQEDGMLAKITLQDGSKAVKVGSRIAVLAESGDDLSNLEMPQEEAPSSSPASQETPRTESKSESQSSSSESQTSNTTPKDSEGPSPGEAKAQKYPLYPSVQMLLHEKGLSKSDADKIPASGPNGRLLKGDVLAYLGQIQKGYSAEQSQRIVKLGHLDLSNVKVAPKAAPPKESKKEAAKDEAMPEPDTEIAVPVNLGAVFEVQQRIEDSLGLTLPLSTFIARASEIANEALPRSKGSAVSADELFDYVLGLDKVKKTSRGKYVPQITAIAPEPLPQRSPRKSADVIDILSGSAKASKAPRPIRPTASNVASPAGENVFSVSAKRGEERRARTYLERVKSILEAEPGRCVL